MATISNIKDYQEEDTPMLHAERLTVDILQGAERISKQCWLTPELYRVQRQYLQEAAFNLGLAFEALDRHESTLIETKYELRG